MPKTVESEVEFNCPKCGGHCYRFNHVDNTHQCKGTGSEDRWSRCSFTWRPEDSWRYFQQVVRITFETPAEYEAACRGEIL